MKTDLESAEFQAMLNGERGIHALDVARDLKEILADNLKLAADNEKWEKEANERGDKVSVLIEEKSTIEESLKLLKGTLAELSK